MLEQDTTILIPKGEMQIKTERLGTSAKWTKIEAAENVESRNMPDYLTRNFLEADSIIERKQFDDNFVVQTMIPTSGYSYFSLMVVAANLYLIREANGGGRVKAHSPFDFSEDVTTEYFKHIIAAIQAHNETPLPDDTNDEESLIIYVENSTYDISNFRHRLSRSIALSHGQIIKVDHKWVNRNRPFSQTELTLEQQITQRKFVQKTIEDLHNQLQQEFPDQVNVYTRNIAPFGYTIATSIDEQDPINSQAEKFEKIMRTNHDYYAAIARKKRARIGERLTYNNPNFDYNTTVVDQPSYRQYFYYQDGKLFATIAPVILSGAGVIEAMEVAILRSPEVDSVYTEEQKQQTMEVLKDNFRRKLKAG